jgi:hypothetical protein
VVLDRTPLLILLVCCYYLLLILLLLLLLIEVTVRSSNGALSVCGKRTVENDVVPRKEKNDHNPSNVEIFSYIFTKSKIAKNPIQCSKSVSAYESQVHPVLSMLLEDDDRDVRFFAEKTESALNAYFASMARDNTKL